MAITGLRAATLLLALGAAACSLNGGESQLQYFDLGPPLEVGRTAVALRDAEVTSPSWLDGNGIQYRLLYADPTRRLNYADNRWIAAPAEMLEVAIKRAVAAADIAPTSGGCKLRIELDDFVHNFDSPTASHARIEVRALLLAPRDTLVARQAIKIAKLSPSPDARGGVVALVSASAELVTAVRDWLDGLARDAGVRAAIERACGAR